MNFFGLKPKPVTVQAAPPAVPAQRPTPVQGVGASSPGNPKTPASEVITNRGQLPSFVGFGDVGENCADMAVLLLGAEKQAYLAILYTSWENPSASALRVHFRKESTYGSVRFLKVNAQVLTTLKAEFIKKDVVVVKTSTAQTELHISRGLEMIGHAIDEDASDIHLEIRVTGRDAPRVVQRLRTHGLLHTVLDDRSEAAVIQWTEVVRGLYQNDQICSPATRTSTTWSASQKQEGMLKPPIKSAEIRFESLPEKGGFDVALRVNGYEGKSAARLSLKALGLSEEQSVDLMRATLAPHGIVVVVGATGSGKTTTVTTTMSLDEKAEEKKRISLEVPPESDIAWLSQLVVDGSDEKMKAMMDGVMRADPDVISGGEVRNAVTGQMAQDFAITGHLTFVTVHANGVFIAIRRLISPRLGFDIDILTMRNFLRAVLYQSLVERLCVHCADPAKGRMSEDKLALLKEKFDITPEQLWVRHVHAPGEALCPHCRGIGISGRTVVAELVVPSHKVLGLVRELRIAEAEAEWRSTRTARFDEPGTNGKTYVEHAVFKATNKEICAESLFGLETLWTYEVLPMAKDIPAAPHYSTVVSLSQAAVHKHGAAA